MNRILLILLCGTLFFQLKAQQFPYNPAKEEIRKGINISKVGRQGNAREAQEGIFGTPPSVKSVDISGGTGAASGNSIISDASNNIYVIGQYHNEIQLGTTTLTGNTSTTHFVAKYDTDGNFTSAINLIDGPVTDINVENAESFLSGFVISGTAENGSYDFGNQSIAITGYQAFVAYFNFDGTLNWIETFDHNRYQQTPMAVKNDSIFVSFGYPSIYLLNNTGNFLKEYSLSNGIVNALAVHGDSLVLGGLFRDEMSIDDITLLSESYYDAAFVGSIAISDGSANWAYEGAEESSWQSSVHEIAVAKDNSLVVGGAVQRGVWWGNIGYELLGGFVTHITAQGAIDTTFTQSDGSYSMVGIDNLIATPDSILFTLSNSLEIGQTDNAFNEHLIRTLLSDENSGGIEDGLYKNGKIYLTGTLDNNMFLMTLTAGPLALASTFTSDGKSGNFEFRSLESDNNNNTITFGTVNGSVSLFGEEFTTTSALYLAKKDNEGLIQWNKFINNASTSRGISNEMSLNKKDNSFFVIGTAQAGFNIAGTPFADVEDNFLAKFSESGSVDWVANIPMNECHSVAVDGEGSAYISGSFSKPVTLGGTTYTPTEITSAYIAKYSATGQFQWLKQIAADGIYLASVSAYGQTISFSGEFQGSQVSLDGTNYPLGENYGMNLLASFSPDGVVNWATTYGADGDLNDEDPYTYYYCWANSLNTDEQGNTYVNGITGGSNIIGDTTLYSPYRYNHFAAKFDAEGNLSWAKMIKTSKLALNYNETELDKAGNFYIYGPVSDTVKFSNDIEFRVSSEHYGGAYVAKLNTEGELIWAYYFDAGSLVNTSGMAVHGENSIEIAGKASPFIASDQTYNSFYGSSFIIGFCELEQTSVPTGSVEVFHTDTTTYQIDAGAKAQVHWHLEPAGAGEVLGSGSEIRIAWNETFRGEAALSTMIENFCGTSEASDNLLINVQSLTTGLTEDVPNHLHVYPNPIQGQLNLTLRNNDRKELSIAIYDMYGKKHLTLEEGYNKALINKPYDVSNLSKGMYILLINDGENSQSKLLFKQ